MKPIRIILIALALLSISSKVSAQNYYRAERSILSAEEIRRGELCLNIEAEGFFRNNEYANSIIADYTLPGYRTAFDFSYDLKSVLPVRLSLGAEHLYYFGASRYPAAIAYNDLPYWRDENPYTRFRIKPRFRAAIAPSKEWLIILGRLEGLAKHRLIEPLFHSELNLTSDSENGFQLRYDTPRRAFDLWIDWQSFIFKHATHPEAFVAGANLRQRLFTSKDSQEQTLDLSLQFLSHHRGGKLNDIKPDTVHTWINVAVGGVHTLPGLFRDKCTLKSELYLLGYSQRGGHFASDRGWGAYGKVALAFKRLELSGSLWYGQGFMGILGSPFVQSLDRHGAFYNRDKTFAFGQFGGTYKIVERNLYTFGAEASVWIHPQASSATSHHLGVYLSISPSFLLKKF
ncbi:MAG: hypothetical protein Q3998_00825 [Porphyromonas sp.]|nr:hypothetical protein [Porphyromonas sp.]